MRRTRCSPASVREPARRSRMRPRWPRPWPKHPTSLSLCGSTSGDARVELVVRQARRTAWLADLTNPAAQAPRDAAFRTTGRFDVLPRLDRIIGHEEIEVAR